MVGALLPTAWSDSGGSVPQAPSLVRAAVARPKDDLRPARGSGAVGVQAQPGLHAGDGAVCVEVPLLVGVAVAVPDDHLGAVAGALAVGVPRSKLIFCRELASAGWAADGLVPAWAAATGTTSPAILASTTLRTKAHLFTVSPRPSGRASAIEWICSTRTPGSRPLQLRDAGFDLGAPRAAEPARIGSIGT